MKLNHNKIICIKLVHLLYLYFLFVRLFVCFNTTLQEKSALLSRVLCLIIFTLMMYHYRGSILSVSKVARNPPTIAFLLAVWSSFHH